MTAAKVERIATTAGVTVRAWGVLLSGDIPDLSGSYDAAGAAAAAQAAAATDATTKANAAQAASWPATTAFDATVPAAVGTAATGSAAKAAHRDHVHPTGAGTPSTQAFGDVAAVGTGPAAAMTDHKHGMPASPAVPSGGTPALTLGTTNAAGAAATYVKTDATVLAFDATNPSTQASADTPVVGTATVAARRDHKHGMPTIPAAASGGTPALTLGTSNSAGVSGTFIRDDDTILAFDVTAPVTQAMGDSAAAGSATVAARRDHKHGMPALGTSAAAIGTSAGGSATTPSKSDHVHATGAGTPSTQAFGDSAATGTGPAAAMTDHKHAMPANPVAYAAPSLTLGTSNSAGVAASAVRTDATILAFDATAPTTSAEGDAAAVGSATVAARRDHLHGRESFGTTTAAVGTSAGGSATTPSKSDHVHATGAGTPSTQAIGDAAATGTGPAAAMTDHKHAMPAFGTGPAAVGTQANGSSANIARIDHVHATGAGTPSTQAFGDAASTGSGPAAAMTDHKHGMPAAPPAALAQITGGTKFYPCQFGLPTNNQADTLNVLFAAPFFCPVSATYDRIMVSVGGAVTNAVARLGIYNDGGGKPGTLLLDAGTIAAATGGDKSITISQALTGGTWYWLACVGQTAAPNLQHAVGSAYSNLGVTTAFSVAVVAAYSQTGISGSLPSPWGASVTDNGRTPLIYLRPQ